MVLNMKRWKRDVLLASSVCFMAIMSYVFYEAYQFAKGIQTDTKRRLEFLEEKQVRIDSLGIVKYEEYLLTKDSSANNK
jgi:hypothetical protein